MNQVRRGFLLLATLMALLRGCSEVAMAQAATTAVQYTVYSADRTAALGASGTGVDEDRRNL